MKRSFVFEKETKNTIRFEEVPDIWGKEIQMVGSIYVQKDALYEMGWDGDESVKIVVDVNIAE